MQSKSQQQYDEAYAQKNDIPDRFWSFIEPYCAPVKGEHVKFLEDLIKSYEDDSLNEYYKVPNTGKHYSTKWAVEAASRETPASTGKAGKDKSDKKKGACDRLSCVFCCLTLPSF